MVYAIRQITVERGYDPRDFALLAFGGGGGLFASALATDLEIPTTIVPAGAAVFSAWGLLFADYREDASLTRVVRVEEADDGSFAGVVGTRDGRRVRSPARARARPGRCRPRGPGRRALRRAGAHADGARAAGRRRRHARRPPAGRLRRAPPGAVRAGRRVAAGRGRDAAGLRGGTAAAPGPRRRRRHRGERRGARAASGAARVVHERGRLPGHGDLAARGAGGRRAGRRPGPDRGVELDHARRSGPAGHDRRARQHRDRALEVAR